MMEIEAKFKLPNRKTLQGLQNLDQLAGFSLSGGQVKQVHDTYLDTVGRRILAAGYACRLREQEDGVQITLKALGKARDAVHRREELEVSLATYQPPAQWPAGPVRERLVQLAGQETLEQLFDLHQTRLVRVASQGPRRVAELSLDEVHLSTRHKKQVLFVLEAELLSTGTEDDLTALVNCLQIEWKLEPELCSKFEQAMIFLENAPP